MSSHRESQWSWVTSVHFLLIKWGSKRFRWFEVQLIIFFFHDKTLFDGYVSNSRWQFLKAFDFFQALICINYDQDYQFEICCRVNADEEGGEKEAVETLWIHLSLYINLCERMLAEWKGIHRKVKLTVLKSIDDFYFKKNSFPHISNG